MVKMTPQILLKKKRDPPKKKQQKKNKTKTKQNKLREDKFVVKEK